MAHFIPPAGPCVHYSRYTGNDAICAPGKCRTLHQDVVRYTDEAKKKILDVIFISKNKGCGT